MPSIACSVANPDGIVVYLNSTAVSVDDIAAYLYDITARAAHRSARLRAFG